MKSEVLIIGAGLTGLLLAYRLKKEGVSVKVIEARNRVGGRIHTIQSTANTQIDMGATWLTKEHTGLFSLLEELNISVFKQFMDGNSFYETDQGSRASEFKIPSNEQSSYRIKGGTIAVINRLAEVLREDELILDEKIIDITDKNNGLTISSRNKTYRADKVITTIPPLLLVNTIQFNPELPKDFIAIANKTHTWMGESIKFGVSFKSSFWKKKRYSGTVFSTIGPITEMYDHSNNQNTKFALKGFLHNSMCLVSKEERKEKVIKQLYKLFGQDIEKELIDYQEVVWKYEKNTTHQVDGFIFPHQNNGHQLYQQGFYNNQLFIAGTETSIAYGGYMEGAIKSATAIYKKLM